MNNRQETINQLRALSKTLDTRFQGPLGTRFGIDGIIGLIPGIGDIITTSISLYIIAQAAALGVGASTLIRMALNVVMENLIDMIPIVGNLFDFYWKSNSRNMALLEKHLAQPARETIKSRMIVALICFTLVAILIASGYVSFLVLQSVFDWISSQRVD